MLDRDVYLMPPKEAGVHDGKLWKLKRCLYGLNDAARQFYQSIVEVLKNLHCRQHSLDLAMFYMKDSKNDLVGMIASHINDFLHVGDPEFDKLVMDKMRERFLAGKLEESQFKYVGFNIMQQDDGILLDQTEYMGGLEDIMIAPVRASNKSESLTLKELSMLRGLVGQMNWAVQGTRPDLAFA